MERRMCSATNARAVRARCQTHMLRRTTAATTSTSLRMTNTRSMASQRAEYLAGQHIGVESRRATHVVSRNRGKMTTTKALSNPFADGIFAPAVRIARQILGKKTLNKVRGKGIALHSQVITSFCKQIGAPAKTKQGLIRLAKKNGEFLGFLV